MKNLSICILAFNKYNYTKSCLDDLSKLNSNHQIIVVDNNSTDETEKELNKRTDILYIKNSENLGFSGGNNIAYNNCKYDNILFLNNDIRVKSNFENWTNIILEKIQDDILVSPTAGYLDPKNNFEFKYETSNINDKINYLSGWCLAGNKNTFEKLKEKNYTGPWNEDYRPAYFEDAHMGFLAKKLNMNFELVDIPVVHFGKVSSKQLNTAKLYLNSKKVFNSYWGKK